MQNFTLEYIITVLLALGSSYIINKGAPQLNTVIGYFIIPLIVAYVSMQFINLLFPHINRIGQNMYDYVEDRTIGRIDSMGYIQIFPVLLIAVFIFFFLLFNGSFSK